MEIELLREYLRQGYIENRETIETSTPTSYERVFSYQDGWTESPIYTPEYKITKYELTPQDRRDIENEIRRLEREEAEQQRIERSKTWRDYVGY